MGRSRPALYLLFALAAATIAISSGPGRGESAPAEPARPLPSPTAASDPHARVSGFVVDEWGIPITDFTVTGRTRGDRRYRRSVGQGSEIARGTFEFLIRRPELLFRREPPSGGVENRYVFRIAAEGYGAARFTATCAEWEALECGEDVGGVQVTLPRATKPVGRVRSTAQGPRQPDD